MRFAQRCRDLIAIEHRKNPGIVEMMSPRFQEEIVIASDCQKSSGKLLMMRLAPSSPKLFECSRWKRVTQFLRRLLSQLSGWHKRVGHFTILYIRLMQSLSNIPELQDEFTREWHAHEELPAGRNGLEKLIVEQHLSNFRLWHEEDKARISNAPAAKVAEVKRSIDRLNQQRNDLIEEIDRNLLESVRHVDSQSAELHSETPGMMIDRLSILSLKLYHTREEAKRRDAGEEHRARNLERLRILEEQRNDLAENLRRFWDDVSAGRRRFKLYRQLKMYNDPALNPEIYRRKS